MSLTMMVACGDSLIAINDGIGPPDGSDGGHRAPEREDGYAGGPDSPVGRTIPAATVGATGISDLGFTQRAQVVGDSSPGPQDSFIMQVLRGWRLLVAASLTQEEWRDILATTGSTLEYEKIADALANLWDERLMGYRQSHQTSQRSFNKPLG